MKANELRIVFLLLKNKAKKLGHNNIFAIFANRKN